jgi:S1-C subfamily serine protease
MRQGTSLVCIAAALAAATAGCGGEPGKATAAKEPSEAKRSLSDMSRAVVSVEGVYKDKKTTATGTIFDADEGLLLTANHAMEGAPNINVRLSDGTLTHARSVARAQCHDLAVLKMFPTPPKVTELPLADSSPVGAGQPVTTLTYLFDSARGARQRLTFTRVQGTVSAVGVREAFPPLPETGPFIAHQTPLLAGAAGSPMVDEQGRMIGLNTLVAHPREPDVAGIEYALTSNYIRTRLRELRPGPGGRLAGWGSEHDACHGSLRNLVHKGHLSTPNAPSTPPATTTSPES